MGMMKIEGMITEQMTMVAGPLVRHLSVDFFITHA
jgi:hypothetical protein